MVRRTALMGISLLLLAACADAGSTPGAPASPSGGAPDGFATRAGQIAAAWRDASAGTAWRTGFVPLGPTTDVRGNGSFTSATKQAYLAGWFRSAVGMPRERGGKTGTIRYADGATESVPLTTMAQAYAELDQGDPPPCGGPTVPPAADAPAPDAPRGPGVAPDSQDNLDPDRPVSSGPLKPCLALTITRVVLGDMEIMTTRGKAEVPAWLFTVREAPGVVIARAAVAASAVVAVPEVKVDGLTPVPGLVSAQDITSASGTRLAYRLGVGACDEDITPVVYETDDVIVVAGTVTTTDRVCTAELKLHPVEVELKRPVGERLVVDGANGHLLTTR